MPLNVKISGGPETVRALAALGKFASAAKVGRQALRPGAREIVKAVRSDAPSQTGRYRRSIKTVVGRGRGDTVARLFVAPTGSRSRRIAHLLEFGTRYMLAQPHFRPALDAKGQRVIELFGREIWPRIAKEVRRLAVRSAVR